MLKKMMLSIFLFAAVVFAQNEEFQNIPKITVTGSAEIKVPADVAFIDFTVAGFGSGLRIAVDKAQNAADEIINKLLQLGLKKEDISTSEFFSGENEGDKPFLSSSKDYRAFLRVTIKIKKIDMTDDIILMLSESKINDIGNIQFSLEDHSTIKEQAQSKALKNAKEKAEKIASQLGVKIKRILSVSVDENNYYPVMYNTVQYRGAGAGQDLSKMIYEKTLSFNQSVRIIFEIE